MNHRHPVSRGRGLAVLAAGLTLTLAGTAQTALYYDYGTACGHPQLPSPGIAASLPVPGWDLDWTVRGQAGAWAFLMFDTGANWSGVDLSPYGLPGCRYWLGGPPVTVMRWLGLGGSAQYTLRAPATTPPGFRLYGQVAVPSINVSPSTILTSELGVARFGIEPSLGIAEIRAFAPVVRIHPGEAWFPMDPLQFVRLSRFRHHRGWGADDGYNKRTLSWVRTDSHHADYYDVPVSFVNTYGPNADGSNRRPRDPDSGSSWNVFLQPVGAPAGDRTPDGDVPVFYHYRRNGGRHEIQYWWFLGYNDAPASFNHQGDWEHVTVHIEQREIVGVHFASHESGTWVPRQSLRFAGGRPVVYMARGTHASYPRPGSFYFGIDETADGGHQWDVAQSLLSLGAQPWKDFAGAWGEVGTIATTTGPLGPWHKRNAP